MNELCRKIRSEILTISHKSGHGHIPTSFSIVEMLCAVYQTMRHDPKRPDMPLSAPRIVTDHAAARLDS